MAQQTFAERIKELVLAYIAKVGHRPTVLHLSPHDETELLDAPGVVVAQGKDLMRDSARAAAMYKDLKVAFDADVTHVA